MMNFKQAMKLAHETKATAIMRKEEQYQVAKDWEEVEYAQKCGWEYVGHPVDLENNVTVNKPEMLNITKLGEVKQTYENNKAALENTISVVSSGVLQELLECCDESAWNRSLTELIVQQEYIRSREEQSWDVGYKAGI